ncbi:hypothetical protein GCM10007079_23730 [Nocardiopsis terrae]|uniref:8-amino-7-oxononanoate synthase n=1 Tax=Nocardiopsis terrae TaxID=372655 RepID=A0ABR9HG54_9ACTN|nr:bifunctional SDR family oxidoreductase/pyridoxal phosphate-dependent aminotransferase family protein [Nocardiopsis terrae]MBE1458019.1 glycine C-acetyltransferase [Nocardiopsis terrae]GHC82988.1 hypothetical protein GCM10007079_23730 [Nocardiopsis terrae]
MTVFRNLVRRDEPLAADHLVGDRAVLPASAQLDSLVTALDAVHPGGSWRLERTHFLAPLAVGEDGVEVETALEQSGTCTVRSRPVGSGAWTENSRGTAVREVLAPPPYEDLATVTGSCPDPVDLDLFREWQQQSGITYGPHFRAVRSLLRGPDRVLALLRTGEEPLSPHTVPPPLLDAAFQCLGFLDGGRAGACLPWAVHTFSVRRRISGSVWCLAERTGGDGSMVRGRFSLFSQQGEILLEAEGVTLRSASPPPEGAPDPAARIAADPARLTPTAPAETVGHFVWDPVEPAPEPSSADAAEVVLRPDAEAAGELPEITRTVEELVYVAPRGVRGAEGANALIRGFFRMVATVTTQRPTPSLTVITDGAHESEPAHTALWGLVRSLRKELPRARLRLVDLGGSPEPTSVPRFAEPELRLIDGVWHRPRLATAPPAPVKPPTVEDKRFLVTGGMGGIGLHVAEHLVDLGCAHLTLVGRSRPGPGERSERLRRLAERCELVLHTGDVCDLGPLLAGSERFHGVFHCAGVLRDGLARSLEPEQVAEVLHPKIGGVHTLADGLGERAPDFVALFSSVAAVHGNLGQTSYAAANAYMDGFAASLREKGLPWYGLAWGLWEVGMGEAVGDGASLRGVPALSVKTGLEMLDTVLAHPPGNYVLTPADATKEHDMAPVTTTDDLWAPLRDILAEALRLERVEPQDNLLELGLDSITAVEVGAALGARGIDIDTAVLFERPDITDLLAHLSSLPAGTAPARPGAQTAPAAAGAVPGASTFNAPWDQYRNGSAPAEPSAGSPAVPRTAPPPSPPAAPPAPPAPAVRVPEPSAPERSGRPSPGPAGPHLTPRRTLPARLSNRAEGTFLERRIDSLSAEDREIVARNDYFYEPVIEAAEGPRIRFDGKWFLNLASYSYLGLLGHDYISAQAQAAVRRFGTGAHGVRLLAGTYDLHRELELAIADFLGAEDAIVYSSGYMANQATLGALLGPGDVVLGDVYNHASILDGYRLSGAQVVTYAHNDLGDLERVLRRTEGSGRILVTDAVFSMDGDIADLPGILDLCERHDVPVMVDEAHSIGVLGATGRGIVEHFGLDPHRVDIKMGTLSKTIPSSGGYVAGSRDLVFALKNNARGWMFSAASTPAQIAAARAALEVIDAAPGMVGRLGRLADRYRDRLHALGFDTLKSASPVVPVLCDSAEQAQEMARLCQADGLFVQPIVYPAVPRALPRLRTIVNLSHSAADLEEAASVLERAGRRLGLIR